MPTATNEQFILMKTFSMTVYSNWWF